MNTESTSLFKLFRVLWFPFSVNAMALGALAALAFAAVTAVGVFFAGGTAGMIKPASNAFFGASQRFLSSGEWPGFEPVVAESKLQMGGLFAGTSEFEKAAAEPGEVQFVRGAFGTWLDTERARADKAMKAEERASFDERLGYSVSRYRAIFGLQVIAFFALLSTFGVAICRIIALRITRDEYCTIHEAIGYAWRVKWTGFVFLPAILLPIAILWGFNGLAGWVMAIPWIGWLLGLLAIPLLYLSSLLMFAVATSGLASLTLIPAAIAVERKSTYDSIGKTANYVLARPLPLILYFVMTGLFLGLVHEMLLERAIVESLLLQSVDAPWAGESFRAMLLGDLSQLSGFQWFCGLFYAVMHAVWQLIVWGILIAFCAGASVSVFLILRREVDGLDYADIAIEAP